MNIITSDVLIVVALIVALYFLVFRKRLAAAEGDVSQLSNTTSWISIGLFILAANIGLDYFIGGAGLAYRKGLAIGSYEWTGIIFMIVALLFVFPKIMSPGIKTTPEYLGYRYGRTTRIIVAVLMLFLHLTAVLVPVFYSAAISLQNIYGQSFLLWLGGIGGLVFVALLWGRFDFLIRMNAILVIMLFLATGIVTIFCIVKIGGLAPLVEKSAGRFESTLASNDDFLPWQTVFFGGLWVAHAYYWSINQFILQSVLQTNTLSKAQFAYLFAATVKLILPFIILIPGIAAYVLYGSNLEQADQALMTIWKDVIPHQISGVLMLGYLTSVIAPFSAIVYACISILVNDIFPASWHKPERQISTYRLTLAGIILLSILGAYMFNEFKKIDLYKYNQYVMNSATPALVAVFGLGIFFKRITALSANIALLTSVPAYLFFIDQFPTMDLLNVGGLVFLTSSAIMVLVSFIIPAKEIKVIPDLRNMAFERNIGVVTWSIFLITVVAAIYVIF